MALYEGFKVKDSNFLEAINFRSHHEIFVKAVFRLRSLLRGVGGGGSKGSNEPPLKFDNGGLKYK